MSKTRPRKPRSFKPMPILSEKEREIFNWLKDYIDDRLEAIEED